MFSLMARCVGCDPVSRGVLVPPFFITMILPPSFRLSIKLKTFQPGQVDDELKPGPGVCPYVQPSI